MKTIIKAKNISKSFSIAGKKQLALKNINLSVDKKELVCIVGPSGCGKSTLLRIISGLTPASSGAVIFPDELKLSMVFQNFALFPWLSVEENVGFGLQMKGESKEKIKREVAAYIKQMGLSGMGSKHPKELSGGMKQRTGIARALAVKPDILFLDEPFSALDAFTAKRLRKDLFSIWNGSDLTVVMISHLIEEAVELAERVIVMSAGPGKIKKVFKINLPYPRDVRSKSFFRYVDKIAKEIKL